MDHAANFLLVDDDPIFLAVAERVVCSLGDHTVSTASDGTVGLEALSRAPTPFDYIILDLNMPEVDGLAFLRAASVSGFKGNVIISSGETEAVLRSARHMAELLGIRIIGTIKKPLSADGLATILSGEAVNANSSPARKPRVVPILETEHLELVPYYQAQHDAYDRSIVGVEALIRGRSSDGQIHGPAKLFSLIHGHNELVKTSLAIAEKVLDDMQGWRAEGICPRTSINFDAEVIEDPDVAPALMRMVREREIRPQLVCFELTEARLPGDLSRLVEVLARLRMAGFHLSVDDFGTGSSNFELLRLCPFSELKIDRSVIRSAATEPIARHFIASAVAMAAELNIAVVGEGIETEAQLALARQNGIDIIQGFLFSLPVPADGIRRCLLGGGHKPEA
jgi:EAL domain-containing protein (putative c-di-GMP-specific phosphodiesterase class I)